MKSALSVATALVLSTCTLPLRAQAPSSAAAAPEFHLEGEKWTYTSPARTFSGYLLRPEGSGPFPAIVINHGKGGRPDQFSLNWAREMVKWGAVCICPTLTHVAGTTIEGQDGASAENIARVADCIAILGRIGGVDSARIAVAGHSMGGFLTIGYCGTAGKQVRAAAIVAGGLAPRAGFAAPPPELAEKITAPFLMLHGTVDRAVAPAMSAALKEILDRNRVPNRREVFVGTDHDLPMNPATRATAFALIREWFTAHGVLEAGKNSPPSVTPPSDHTIAAAAAPARLTFSVADSESPASGLIVTAASSNSNIVLESDITLQGDGADRILLIKPLAGKAGPTTIFLTVTDGRLVTTRSFVLGFADASGVVPQPEIDRRPPPGRGPPGAAKKKAN